MTPRPPSRLKSQPLEYPAHDTSGLPNLPEPDEVQGNLQVEVTRIEQRWPCWGLKVENDPDDPGGTLSEALRIADELQHQRQWSETRDPPVIGDEVERYVEQAMGQERLDAAKALGAGYIAWISPPVWRVERDHEHNVWRRLYHARGALVRIIPDA